MSDTDNSSDDQSCILPELGLFGGRRVKPLKEGKDPRFLLPPIPPIPLLDKDNWAQHPLLRYNAKKERRKQDDDVVISRGKKVKTLVTNIIKKRQIKPCAALDDTNVNQFLTQEDFAEFRRDSVKAAPVIPISESWLRKIASLIPKNLRKNHQTIFRALIKEAEERYESVLHETILNLVLVPHEGCVNPYALVVKFPLYSQAPPPWRDTFGINRRNIAINLRLLYPTVTKTFLKMRQLMQNHRLFVPTDIVDQAGSGYLRSMEIKDIIVNQIRRNGALFLSKFTPYLVRVFQNPSVLKRMAEEKQELIMECASHMIVCNAMTWAMDTITQIVEAYENYEKNLPRILLDTAVNDGKVTFAPPMEGWMSCLKEMIDEIVCIVQAIPDVAELFWRRKESDKSIRVFCLVALPKFFLDVMTNRFQAVMNNWLIVAQIVCDRIYKQFSALLDGSAREKLMKYIAVKDHSFYDGFKESVFLKVLGQAVYGIPKSEFCGWIQVNNEDVIGKLLDSCETQNNIIKGYLAKWIRAKNYSIIKMYKEMKDRLLQKPTTTAELMDLIEYIDEVRTFLIAELRDKITEGIRMALAFLDYYVLSADDMELCKTANKLYRKIQPAFEKAAIPDAFIWEFFQVDPMIEDQKLFFEEKLHKKAEEMRLDLKKLLRRVREDFGRYGDYDKVPEYFDDLQYVRRRVKVLQEGIEFINNEETLFKFNQTEFEDMKEITMDIESYTILFETTRLWQRADKKYMDGDFDLDAAQIDEESAAYLGKLIKLQSLFKSRIKIQKEQEAKEKHIPVTLLYDEDNLESMPAPMRLCNLAIEKIKVFREYLPTMYILCNPDLRIRHWEQMAQFSKLNIVPNTGSSLRKILAQLLDPFMDEFEEISFCSTQEELLKKSVENMQKEWENKTLDFVPYKDTETFILKDADILEYTLTQQTEETQILRGSRFVPPHLAKVIEWEDTLLLAKATLDEWLAVQKRWIYLEDMFSSKEMHALLPVEGHLFAQVDKHWRNIMVDLDAQTNVIQTVTQNELLEELTKLVELLEAVMTGVNAYIEEKRVFFPRMYFLTTQEIVQILSETKDPYKIQPLISKLFPGIHELRIGREMLVLGMRSSAGETINFSNPVDTMVVKGAVEKWLFKVEEEMLGSMKRLTTNARDAYLHTSREKWVLKWPGQIVIAVSQIYWTFEMHKAFSRGISGLEIFLTKWTTHLTNCIALLRGGLQGVSRVVLNSLITVDLHSRDVIQKMIDDKVQADTEFEWQVQLRYYFEDFQVVMKIINAHINYGYEYIGNPPRLVITPLTERCYRILIGAYHLNLFGTLLGPDSVGKTQTALDLANAVAKFCVIINCSTCPDSRTYGRIMKGLASAGAWVNLDDLNFEVISPGVLNVLAQHIWTIQQSIAAKLETVTIEDTILKLNPDCNILITTNTKFAGITEIPETLKTCFRSVSMAVPNFAMIAEVFLYSAGFTNPRSAALKTQAFFQLCFEQLSNCQHYDFGMRGIKVILCAAMEIKNNDRGNQEEVRIIGKAIHDVTFPKIIPEDVAIFDGIMEDLFPGVKLLEPAANPIVERLKTVCRKRNLQPTDFFIGRILQLHEMILLRHGIMIVGDALCGKTCTYQCLAAALTDISNDNLKKKKKKQPVFVENSVEFKIVNPKAMTLGQLYGAFDPVSNEWSDGIVANTFREFSVGDKKRKWLVFDGLIDAAWIENLNTVLDDNKKLCLKTGESIPLPKLANIMFETADLEQASPATVSRCGVIYLDPKKLGWRSLKLSFLHTLSEKVSIEQKEILDETMEWILPPCFYFVKKSCTSFLPMSELHQFQSFARLYGCILKGDKKENTPPQDTTWLQYALVFCVIWGLGSTLIRESREMFDVFCRQLLLGNNQNHPKPKSFKLVKNQLFPEKGRCFDYICDKNMGWMPWLDLDRELHTIPANSNINDLIIPTDETSRQKWFLKTLLPNEHFVLFIGPTGTGKSVLTTNYILALPKDKYIPTVINFLALTSASQTQDTILSKLDIRKRGVFGPPDEKKCIVFLDDLSMPQKDGCGSQPPIELMRQLIDHGIWYDRDKSTIRLEDMLLVGAMSPGRNDICPRFVRHASILGIDVFDDFTLKKIFTAIVDWHFKKDYDPEILRWAQPMVQATMQVYKSSISSFLPTPVKPHYLFNLRDFSRVIRGLLLIPPLNLQDPKKFQRLWVHEVCRVFYDRLNNEKDRILFFNLVSSLVNENFKTNIQKLLGHLAPENEPLQDKHLRNLIFGDYMDHKAENKIYDEVVDLRKLSEIMDENLIEYNSTSMRPMPLVLFQFAIEHISKIARVLKQDNGHALLLGFGGSGRRSLTRIAAFMARYSVIQIEFTRAYGKLEWKKDIKKLLKLAGADGKQTVFLIADNQIKDKSFLEDINMILNTGEVANLFQPVERGEILGKMEIVAKENRKKIHSRLELYNYFIERVRANLHIVLTMSPARKAFRQRIRVFPSLITCCTINWFAEWPEDALEKVAQKSLANLDTEDWVRQACVLLFPLFHESARNLSKLFFERFRRKTYITHISYLQFILAFKTLLKKKYSKLDKERQRYLGGLEKLEFISAQVTIMRDELLLLPPVLNETIQKIELILKKIETETAEIETTKKLVAKEEKLAEDSAETARLLKEECESDFAQALPILEAALAALDTLQLADIAVVRSMKNPPAAVRMVVEAVCVLRGVKPEKRKTKAGEFYENFWAPAVRMMAEMQFLDQLKEFDKDNIPQPIMKTIREKYINNPEFDHITMKQVSTACEILCMWVQAIEIYDRVITVVKPKMQELEATERDLQSIHSRLEEKRRLLQEHLAKFQALKNEYDAMLAKKREIEAKIELCTFNLQRAEKLMQNLKEEKLIWMENAEKLNKKRECSVGDVLIGSAIISYLGPFTDDFRKECVTNWLTECVIKKILFSSNFSLVETFGNPVQIRAWRAAGLPRDAFLVDNCIIATNAGQWPLMIDPQEQGRNWITNMEKDNGLVIIKLVNPDFLKICEKCIRNGLPVLLDNVGEGIDDSLEPILLKQTFNKDGIVYMQIGENIVEYHNDFRFYINTRLRNPQYLPEVAAKVTLINFLITPVGLRNILLDVVADKEDFALEEKRIQLIAEVNRNEIMLKDAEGKILQVLSDATGNILEDETAVEILLSSANLAQDIQAKLPIFAEVKRKINEDRCRYEPVSHHASLLFFCISDLANIDQMYQYSFPWFVNLYTLSITNSKKTKDMNERIKTINDHFTLSVFQNVCRSLYERHKLVASFTFYTALLKAKTADFDKGTWNFLLSGKTGDNPTPNPAPEWLTDKSWSEIAALSKLPKFENFLTHFVTNIEKWKAYYDAPEPQDFSLPAPWHLCNDMEKMAILRCFRPDKLLSAVRNYVSINLGREFIEAPVFQLEDSYKDSEAKIPLIFILSPGNDPTLDLFNFAEKKGYTGSRMRTISLEEEGQGLIARKMIDKATIEGSWVLLQNCHLAVSWLPVLEIICQDIITTESTHPDFRLWLTTYPSPKFPVSVLQNSVKIIKESPQSLRDSLLRNYLSQPICEPKFFGSVEPNSSSWRRMLFGLCFFHGVVKERGKFGPIGWNNLYEFSDSDFKISLMQLRGIFNDYAVVPFDALIYLISECNYGGRVTDDKDSRLLKSLAGSIYKAIVEEENSFLSSSGIYRIPGEARHNDCLEYIRSLPQNPNAEVFGLHENANITKGEREAKLFMSDVLKTQLQLQISVGEVDTDTDMAGQQVVKVAQEILDKISEDFDIQFVVEKYPVDYNNSMNIVLRQELIRFNKLIKLIRESLKSVQKAVAGLLLMSPELEETFCSVLLGKIPTSWKLKSYPSLKPLGSYIKDLIERLDFCQQWVDNGPPTVFWFSAFYFPQSFLTGNVQNYARKHKVAIELLGLKFAVSQFERNADAPPEDGALFWGLFLEGARWDRNNQQLAESHPKILFDRLPVIWLKPGITSKFVTRQNYDCPVYITSARAGTLSTTGHSTNFLMFLKLATAQNPQHWINRGTAALCQLDD